MNKHEITLIGVGEMGGVFARGFLKSGYTVKPATRQQSIPDKLAETDMQYEAIKNDQGKVTEFALSSENFNIRKKTKN